MSTNSDPYVGRLLTVLTGGTRATAGLFSGSGWFKILSGTSTKRTATSGPGVSTALRIGSALVGQAWMGSTTSPAKGIGSFLGSAASPAGILATFLTSLFGPAAKAQTTVKPPKYEAAIPVHYNLGLTGTGDFASVDRSGNGEPRIVNPSSAGVQRDPVIQVQTMDSRFFLDHSNEIAEAVRQALLESHPLRDVLTE